MTTGMSPGYLKGELDDAAVLESERVQMDVGRPRLRLTLADEYASLSVPELLRESTQQLPTEGSEYTPVAVRLKNET